MPLRAPRTLRTVVVGGLLIGATAIGAGSAAAAPEPTEPPPVPARCGQTVEAAPGQTVRVTPTLGLPFLVPVEEGMDPIRRSVSGVLCRVKVDVVEPVTSAAAQAAPPLRPVTEAVEGAAGTAEAATDPEPEAAAATPAVPDASAAPAFTPQQAAAAAPAFAPAFGTLPSSFLRDAAGPAPGGGRFDAATLLGSAFGGLRADLPGGFAAAPVSAVTTASQVQALPVAGLANGGVGVPSMLAVLGLAGVTALVVRRFTLRPQGRTARSAAADDARD
ncbi:hypothetical protein [Actinomycetospora chibensis]|uniref:Uncharacterized protein n=1 Tax=Actinomycetospora chibensis TaxID=663606 RepID=A0ABV9RI79_9PSEU|nr:hypothetical protein [Actinomycetospora chibensis]MDD7925111.1 hypothetical protein [Actinomycetospora chibensis]